MCIRDSAGGRDVGSEPIRREQAQGDEHAALELRNLGDVLEALQALDHAGMTSTRPPAATSFSRAASLILCVLTTRAWPMSPSARTFTAPRPAFLINPFATRASGSTTCLLYTSDAADERSSVDLGGRRIIKKK